MKLPIIRLLWLLTAAAATAATHAVLPDEAIQPKIDAAAPGDIIAIFGGTYPGDVTINKAVRLVEVDGQEVTITGNVTWNGVTDAPPFEGFTVGSAGKGLTVNNTTGLVIKNVDASGGGGIITVGNSKATIIGGRASKIEQDGGELNVTLTEVSGVFSASNSSFKTVAFKTSVAGTTSWGSKLAWFGYSNSGPFKFTGSLAKVVIVGCSITTNTWVTMVELGGTQNKFLICNNKIYGATWAHKSGKYYYPGMGVYEFGGNTTDVFNNYIALARINTTEAHDHSSAGAGIAVQSVSSRIFNNLISGAESGVAAPFGVTVRNNSFFNTYYASVVNGAVAEGSIFDNPLFVSGQAPLLQATSPCINAGVTEPIFNDLDGTRNDIGPSGGCLFDPEGWTTNKPVVISFDLTPQQLLKGVDTSVNLSNGQAVGQP